jgi:hypothetical protein
VIRNTYSFREQLKDAIITKWIIFETDLITFLQFNLINISAMKAISIDLKKVYISVIFDIMAVAFIFLLPAFSHMLAFPLYLIDPMRIALILSIVITNRKNAYLIAFLLPIVSFMISSHPLFYKVLLISSELVLNTWLFYILFSKTRKLFISAFLSIIASKIFYYIVKFAIIYFAIEKVELISTPLYIQAAVALLLSLVVVIFFRKKVKS